MGKLSNFEKDSICARYIAGEPSTVLAKTFSVSSQAILQLLKKRGIHRRSNSESHRSVMVNRAAFSVATPAALYWAGFLMADGSITRNNTLSVVLSAKDRGHLVSLKRFLGSEHKLISVHRPPSAPAFRLAIRCEQLTTDLARWGVHSNKDHTAKAEAEAITSSDFWRGVVDGDGCLSQTYKRPYPEKHHRINALKTVPRLSLVGSEPLMHQFLQFVRDIVPSCRATIRPHKSIFCVELSHIAARNVIHELYSNCTIGLLRKVNAAANLLAASTGERYGDEALREWEINGLRARVTS